VPLVLAHDRYTLPCDIDVDVFQPWDDLIEELCAAVALDGDDRVLALASVWMYDHSLVSFRRGALRLADNLDVPYGKNPFADPGDWDSGVVGLAVITAGFLTEIGHGRDRWADAELFGELIDADLAAYTTYVNGHVVGFRAVDPDGEEIAACYGFYSWDEAMAQGIDEAKAYAPTIHQRAATWAARIPTELRAEVARQLATA
jgi:hypothetical protein